MKCTTRLLKALAIAGMNVILLFWGCGKGGETTAPEKPELKVTLTMRNYLPVVILDSGLEPNVVLSFNSAFDSYPAPLFPLENPDGAVHERHGHGVTFEHTDRFPISGNVYRISGSLVVDSWIVGFNAIVKRYINVTTTVEDSLVYTYEINTTDDWGRVTRSTEVREFSNGKKFTIVANIDQRNGSYTATVNGVTYGPYVP